MCRKLMDDARQRRADINPLQLILGGDFTLTQLGDPGFAFAELLHDIGEKIVIDLYDLQLGFGDLSLSLRDLCNYIADRPLIAH